MKKSIIRGAIERIKAQAYTPVSPCTVDDRGNLNLCAAAAVALAGLLSTQGVQAAKEFEESLKRNGEVALLYSTFEKLGWEREVCTTMKTFNDSISPTERSEEVIRFLDAYPTVG